MSGSGAKPVLGPIASRLLLRLAERVVPEVAAADAGIRNTILASINEMLKRRTARERLEFKLLVLALGIVVWPLPARAKDAVLRFLENAPLTILRVGVWGLKTLVFMGYYSQETAVHRIHYEPSRTEGNDILHRQRPGG